MEQKQLYITKGTEGSSHQLEEMQKAAIASYGSFICTIHSKREE
jgi:hypothetical protein